MQRIGDRNDIRNLIREKLTPPAIHFFRRDLQLHPEVAEFAADAVSSNAVPLQAVRSEMSSGRRLDFSDGQA